MRRNAADLARLSLALALVAIALSAWVWKAGAPMPGDEWLTVQLQSIDALHRNAGWVNRAGDLALIALVATAIWIAVRPLLTRRRAMANRSEVLVSFAVAAVLGLLNPELKLIVDSPRPAVALGIRVDGTFSGSGYPSGHVYGDVLAFGILAVFAPAYLPRWAVLPARAVFVAIIVLSGAARVSVGAHWPSDTAGGYLWGGAALCLALAAGRWSRARG